MAGYFLLGLIGSVIVAAAASARGRNALGWWLYGLLLWPVALIHVLVLTPTPRMQAERARAAALAEGRVPCPQCAELILAAARLCPHCRSEIPPPPPAAIRPRGLARLQRRQVP